jgi:hypothetical protein
VKRAARLAAREGGVRVAGACERALGVQRDDGVDRRVDLRDPGEVRGDDLLGGRLAARDDGRQRRGRPAGELGRPHGSRPYTRPDARLRDNRLAGKATVRRRCG